MFLGSYFKTKKVVVYEDENVCSETKESDNESDDSKGSYRIAN